MSEDKSLDYKKRFSSELTTLPVFRDDQMWNNGDLTIGPDLQVRKIIKNYFFTQFHYHFKSTHKFFFLIVLLQSASTKQEIQFNCYIKHFYKKFFISLTH